MKFITLYDELKYCWSSLVIGDKYHENTWLTSRFYENIIYGLINFIDIEFDINKKIYQSELLKKYLYVKGSDDLVHKLNKIKNNPDLYKKIIEEQSKILGK